MKHADHVGLLRPANLPGGGTWVDLGAGTGAFTLALRELVGDQAVIYAVDKNRDGLGDLEREYARRFGETRSLRPFKADFSDAIELPPLDGALMANSLHFVRNKAALLQRVRALLKPGGVLLLVEYNVDRGNAWVPFPCSFRAFTDLAPQAGFGRPRLIATHPSSFLGEFYCAKADVV